MRGEIMTGVLDCDPDMFISCLWDSPAVNFFMIHEACYHFE